MAELYANATEFTSPVTLTAGVDADDTSFAVSATAPVSLRGGTSRWRIGDELVLMTIPANGLSPWTGVRGSEGSTAAAHSSGAIARHLLTAGGLSSAVESGSGHVIENEGSALTARANMNFVGAGVTAADAGGKTVVTIPGGGAASGPFFDASAAPYNALGDGKLIHDGAMTNTSAVLSSTAYTFVAGDVGASIVVKGAASGGTDLVTSIVSVASGDATLDDPCSNTGVTSVDAAWYHTDDQAAIQAAIDDAYDVGGTAFVPGLAPLVGGVRYYPVGQHATELDRCLHLPAKTRLLGDGLSSWIQAIDELPGAVTAIVRTEAWPVPGGLDIDTDLSYAGGGVRVDGILLDAGLKNATLEWGLDLPYAIGPWLLPWNGGITGSGPMHRIGNIWFRGQHTYMGGLRNQGNCSTVDWVFAWGCARGGIVDNGADNTYNGGFVAKCGGGLGPSVVLGASGKLSNLKIYCGPTVAETHAALRMSGEEAQATNIEFQECGGCAIEFVSPGGGHMRVENAHINCNGDAIKISGNNGCYCSATIIAQNFGTSGLFIPLSLVKLNGSCTKNEIRVSTELTRADLTPILLAASADPGLNVVVVNGKTDYDTLIQQAPSVLAYWPMDEVSGSTVRDLIRAADDPITGTVALNQPGIDFLGTGFVDVPNVAALQNLATWTLECWVRATINQTNAALIESVYSTKVNYTLNYNASGAGAAGKVQAGYYQGGWQAANDATVLPAATGAQEQHVVGTYDGTTIKVYRNGKLAGSTAHTATPTADAGAHTYLGKGSTTATVLQAFMRRAAMYGRALTAAEVVAHYKAGLGG